MGGRGWGWHEEKFHDTTTSYQIPNTNVFPLHNNIALTLCAVSVSAFGAFFFCEDE